MKNFFLFTVLIALLPFASFSQDVLIGLKSGVNISNLSGTVNENPKWKTGIILGGYLQVPLSNQTFYQPEIIYSEQGSKSTHYGSSTAVSSSSSRTRGSKYSTRPEVGETKTKMNYINILPLSLKVYFNESRDINMYVGPQVGFLLSAKEEGEVDGSTVDEELSDFIKPMDFSAVVGLGVDFPVGLNFGTRLNYGLTDISKLSKVYTSNITRPNLTNIVFQFHLGYTFKGGE